MSDEKDKRFKINMSFEDAMKKAATTKVNPAILIEGKDKQYEIPNAAGNSVEFVSLEIPGKLISQYELHLFLNQSGQYYAYTLPLSIQPDQRTTDKIIFEPIININPILVKKGFSLIVKVMPNKGNPGGDFEHAILTYKFRG